MFKMLQKVVGLQTDTIRIQEWQTFWTLVKLAYWTNTKLLQTCTGPEAIGKHNPNNSNDTFCCLQYVREGFRKHLFKEGEIIIYFQNTLI